MAGLIVEESELRRELHEKSLLIGDRAEHLLKFANKLRQELRAGAEFLNAESLSPELAQKQVQTRRRIVEEIVERVDLLADKTIRVKFVLDLAEAGQIETTPPPPPAP